MGLSSQISGMELVAKLELQSDSAFMTLLNIPDNRKYYLIYFQSIHKSNNSFNRIRFNSITGNNIAHYSHNRITGVSSTNINQPYVTAGGNSGNAGVLTGLIRVQKIQGLDTLGFEISSLYENSASPSVAPDLVQNHIGKINTVRNFDAIEFFANNGNIGAGSYIEVYGSESII